MDRDIITIDLLNIGEKAKICRLLCGGEIRRRLCELGFYDGAVIECVGRSPLGEPFAYMIGGAIFAIRRSDAEMIEARRMRQDL